MVIAVIVGMLLFDHPARSQDAAWEGLINAGRNALQQSNFSEAERHFEEALETAERFPSDDPRLGKSYNNLAAVYYAQEDYARAEPLMRRALAQLREALGPENTEVAQTMKNLAALYYLQGNRSEAEALLKQSLAILEEVHGPNHAFVATVLSNLAGLYQAEDRFQDAEPLLTRSLAIWESLLGSDHPDVVRSRSLLAQVREAQGGPQERGATGAPEPVDRAEARPKALTSLAETAANQPPADEASGRAAAATAATEKAAEEIARATEALEQLTEASKAGFGFAEADGVPVPALNPIGDTTAAKVTAESGAETDAPTPAAEAVRRSQASVPANGVVTSALGTVRAGDAAKAAAILEGPGSANDVTFSVYLSTLWSIDEARRYWQAMQDAMPDLLSDKRIEIEEVAAASGSDPFYRVLTFPFSSDPEAQATCDRIKSKLRTHDCSVVVRETTAGG